MFSCCHLLKTMPCKVLAYSTTNCSMLCCIFTDRHTVQYIDAATCTVQYVETIGRSESSRYCKRVHFTFTRSAPLMLTVLYAHHCCFPQFACLQFTRAFVHSFKCPHSCCPQFACLPQLLSNSFACTLQLFSISLHVHNSCCP